MDQISNQDGLSRRTILRVGAVVAAGLLLLGGALFLPRYEHRPHKVDLKVYFKDAKGLRAGAPVRFHGVDVGYVAAVRVRPERREKPTEVLMRLKTPYSLQVPRDAAAQLATAGLLGGTYVDITITTASGPPAKSGDELIGIENNQMGEFEIYFGTRRTNAKGETSSAAQPKPSSQ